MAIDEARENLAARRTVVFATILVLVLIAWANRFVQDDAFISFRYAENMAQGHGLVWNAGEDPVEGYTNFSWTVLIAGAIALGFGPVGASYVLGLLAFAGSLLLTRRVAYALFESHAISWLAVVLLGTNFTFSSFATGGLETQLQACLVLAVLSVAVEGTRAGAWRLGPVVAASLAAAACMMTRLDSVVLLALPLFFAFVGILREPGAMAARILKAAGLTLPFIAAFGGWLLWKQGYYGDILPNSYYAKVSAGPSMLWGLTYLVRFFVSYWLFPVAVLLLVASGALLRTLGGVRFAALAPTFALWMLYIVKVGGDFMEFRFMVPLLPLFFILVAWLLLAFIERRWLRLALLALILVGSAQHSKTFGVIVPRGEISTIGGMQTWLYNPERNWVRTGEVLREKLPEGTDVSIGVTAAGAIPYYSKLHTIDMLGLNDAWIARNGRFLGDRARNQKPGHLIGATYDYMQTRGTHLVLGHPFVVHDSRFTRAAFIDKHYAEAYVNDRFYYGTAEPGWIESSGATLIRIPIDRGHSLIALYMFEHPHIEELVRQGEWELIPLEESP